MWQKYIIRTFWIIARSTPDVWFFRLPSSYYKFWVCDRPAAPSSLLIWDIYTITIIIQYHPHHRKIFENKNKNIKTFPLNSIIIVVLLSTISILYINLKKTCTMVPLYYYVGIIIFVSSQFCSVLLTFSFSPYCCIHSYTMFNNLLCYEVTTAQ